MRSQRRANASLARTEEKVIASEANQSYEIERATPSPSYDYLLGFKILPLIIKTTKTFH